MHRPLTSRFGRRLLCFWGQFVGTYSALAYAACAGWREGERPVRCGFAFEVGVGSALHRHAQCVPMQLPYSTLLPGGDDPPQGARWDVPALRPHVAVLRDDGRGRSPQRPQSAGFCECPEGCCQLPVGPWAQLVFPACDGLGGSLLGGRGACPSTLGEHEQWGRLSRGSGWRSTEPLSTRWSTSWAAACFVIPRWTPTSAVVASPVLMRAKAKPWAGAQGYFARTD